MEPKRPSTKTLKISGKIDRDTESRLIKHYESYGWTRVLDDPDLTFSLLVDDEHEWMDIYDRRTGKLLSVNAREVIQEGKKKVDYSDPRTKNDPYGVLL